MTITRRRLLALPTTLAALAMLTSLGCEGDLKLTVDRELVQERVEQKFPLERPLNERALMTMSNPVIDFDAGPDRVGLTTDVEVAREGLLAIAVKGKARTSGHVRYDREASTFFMTDVKIESVDVPIKLSEARKEALLGNINATLSASYKDIPLYTLSDGARDQAAKALLKEVRVADGKLLLVIGPK